MKGTRTKAATALAVFLLAAAPALANKSSVTIEAPAAAASGSEVTIRINVAHRGNNAFHHTNLVRVTVNGKEAGRWEFKGSKKPEAEKFSREVKVRVDADLNIEARAFCNIHGSAGPAAAVVKVQALPEGGSR